jgi:hypothetical protein
LIQYGNNDVLFAALRHPATVVTFKREGQAAPTVSIISWHSAEGTIPNSTKLELERLLTNMLFPSRGKVAGPEGPM